ncbi:DUF3224 domain-containing protein [Streptosporangium sp. KLBMP 9127]|nr:DUF3224 domain-containing protein [Streptosporangium sp. KLBMP 9127]
MIRVNGTFDIDGWDDEPPYDEREGAKLAKVRVTKSFHGGLEGTSRTDIITVVSHGDEPMAYSGFERFSGRADGRQGTFVLMHVATSVAGEPKLSWRIVPGSGTGELAGIAGEGQIAIGPDGSHSYAIDYELA